MGFNSGDGGGTALAGEGGGDLVGGELLGAQGEDAAAEGGPGIVGGGGPGRARGWQEEGALGMAAEVGEQVTQGAGGVAEALGGFGERELVDEEGAEGFVAAVIGVGGLQEADGEVVHGHILTDTLNTTQ